MNIGLAPVDAFIARWQGRERGQERANYALFLTELCDVLGVSRPDPATASTEENDYVFERAVKRQAADGRAGCLTLPAVWNRFAVAAPAS